MQNQTVRNYSDLLLKEIKPEEELKSQHCNMLFYHIQEANTKKNCCYTVSKYDRPGNNSCPMKERSRGFFCLFSVILGNDLDFIDLNRLRSSSAI